MRNFFLGLVLFLSMVCTPLWAAENNPKVVTDMLNRIGGAGTSERIVTILDESLSANGKEVFVITSQSGKPCIKGSTLLAITTGVNWYLNHYAHVNLAWNNLTTDMSLVQFPVPNTSETHTCVADYRYYLNYCTFSYSMSTWTWERWQQEIDWMALHGINMPLQIVGLDVVWRNLLMEKYGYTKAEANAFVAGPSFQAWWGMNNLEGWGGPNPDWWYTRQAELAGKIGKSMRDFGMEPVLPGFSGMVPSNFTTKTQIPANNQGNWCQFGRPYILNPNHEAFATMAANYYAELEKVMGTSTYYSMDPFHEGANTNGIDVPAAYTAIANAMFGANADAKWVIQFWQWHSPQYNVLDKVAKGKLIVLDLFSDAHIHFADYKNHDAVWCMLPNFGGRTGFFGRFDKVIDGYFSNKATYSNIKGIGATPEAIESMPVLYDILFELPWRSEKPVGADWMAEYATSRYGVESTAAQKAWDLLRNSALKCETSLQGPHEAVVCARPSLTVNKVSSWGGTGIFYNPQDMTKAAYLLLEAALSGANYSYDLTDISRQALTDYSYYLLKGIEEAHNAGATATFEKRRDAFLQLIADLDVLLSTNSNFMVGRWTQMARGIADEAAGTTTADKNWLELNNARTLITTWGDRAQANNGGLRDYSYRQWAGMLKDFYLPRWQKFFDNMSGNHDWFAMEWAWARNAELSYSDQPIGNTAEVATRLLAKYFIPITKPDGDVYYIYRSMSTDMAKDIVYSAYRGTKYSCPVTLNDANNIATFYVDANNDGIFAKEESASGLSIDIPADAVTTQVKARLVLTDATEFTFSLTLKDNITVARTVTVLSADNTQGQVSIKDAQTNTVTNTEYVTISATPATGYDFLYWTDAEDNKVSTDATFTYYGKDAATFTAHFMLNKWGSPAEDLSDMKDIRSYKQYVSSIVLTQNNENVELYSASSCPEQLFNTSPTKITAAPGGSFIINWTNAGGLSYTYLSAYIDYDGDGEFNLNNELLASKGKHNSTSNEACSGPISVQLPYDMPIGLTHIRLRFDGAWKSGYDATTGAYPAKNTANRMVYDILVDVREYPEYACTVTVESSNTNYGTVDANGQDETFTYKVGEDVVLRAYPADGCYLKHWEDQYGRILPTQWMEGHNIRFKAFDNITIKAVLFPTHPEKLTIGSWEIKADAEETKLTLTEVLSGSGVLELPAEYEFDSKIYTIAALAPGFLKGNKNVTSLLLPATIVDMGEEVMNKKNEMSWVGDGTKNRTFDLEQSITGTDEWRFVAHVTTDGSCFNQFGSGLIATGTDALGTYYNDGFQFYLSKNGNMVMKCASVPTYEGVAFKNNLGNSFTIDMRHFADGKVVTTLTGADGKSETLALETGTKLANITKLCSSIPKGVNITKMYFEHGEVAETQYSWGNASANEQNTVALATPLSNTEGWTFLAEVAHDGKAFNEWGSSILSSGDKPFVEYYTKGFQYYLKVDGRLVFKFDGKAEDFYTLPVEDDFKIWATFDGVNRYDFTLITADGRWETKTFHSLLNPISTLSYGVAPGTMVNMKVNCGEGALFAGCTKLSQIVVDEKNPLYASIDDVLYDKGGNTLLRVPEGLQKTIFTLTPNTFRIGREALHGAQTVERVSTKGVANLSHVSPLALPYGKNYLQVEAEQCAQYADKWTSPLLVSVAAGTEQNADVLNYADVVEICANSSTSGTLSADMPNVHRLLQYTFATDEAVVLYFPTVVKRMTLLEDTKKTVLTPAEGFTFYKYNNGIFVEQNVATWNSIPAGVYALMPKSGVTANKQVCFDMGAVTTAVAATGVGGNGTLCAQKNVQNVYGFVADKSLFQPTSEVAPFAAYRASEGGEVALPFLQGYETLILNDTETTFTMPSNPFATLTMNRTFRAGDRWNTLCLPFAITPSQVGKYFSKVVELSDVSSSDETGTTLNFTEANEIKAGKSYLVMVEEDRTTTNFGNVYLESEVPTEQAVDKVTFVGNYEKMSLSNNEYFISNNTFYYATPEAPATLKGYRAYLLMADGELLVKQMNIGINGAPTSINKIVTDGEDARVSVYSLSGVMLRHNVLRSEALKGLPKGMYLVNGEKVVF